MRGGAASHPPVLLVLEPRFPFFAAVGPVAAVDDDGHVRVVLVVLDHLVVELVGELPRNDAIDHGPLIVGRKSEDKAEAARIRGTCCDGTSGGSLRWPERQSPERSSQPCRSAAARPPAHTPPQTSHARLQPEAAALAFQRAITAVVHELSPSVVQIQNPEGLGSGVVFDSNGDIVTNNHVVEGGGPYTVTAGPHSYGASLVGRFSPDDLAILHVSGPHLTPAAFADPSKLDVGDFGIAIGNPLGLRSSVTEGIVSAFRQGVSEGNGIALPSMLQT